MAIKYLDSNHATEFASALAVNTNYPLDARAVADYKRDLTDSSSWQWGKNRTNVAYRGMIVVVINDTDENNGVYYLNSDTPSNIDNWIKLSTGSGSGIKIYVGTASSADPSRSATMAVGDYWLDTSSPLNEILKQWTERSGTTGWVQVTDLNAGDHFIDEASDADYLYKGNGDWVCHIPDVVWTHDTI